MADYGLHIGGPADLVVFDARSEAEALRLQRPRFQVPRAGRLVAATGPARGTVTRNG